MTTTEISAATPEDFSGDDDTVAVALAGAGSAGDGGLPATAAVRVVHGAPDEVELAALVAGLVAARAAAVELGGLPDEGAEQVRTRWTDRTRPLGAGPVPGPGSWRWSLHP
ncbi:acyl-CoA carboxylase epsilon subunit [Georgenia muralis]|uniref:Acyl-CoA carboxylase epsilon subunit-like protein n=1 Tax=Georgenia muralis TaxID=154117 RepID=A0A3N4Z4D4_9MICO|nr:acyl-CoA carboxylase epsilon subunit [Georgenia muralis]RPF25940.1 acyl-CoA carboxylase epsilon subunit-like protein [Georgenia muralis]